MAGHLGFMASKCSSLGRLLGCLVARELCPDALEEGSGPRVLLKSGHGNRGRSACGTTHVARLEFPRASPGRSHAQSRGAKRCHQGAPEGRLWGRSWSRRIRAPASFPLLCDSPCGHHEAFEFSLRYILLIAAQTGVKLLGGKPGGS